jgi:hypothetical protein
MANSNYLTEIKKEYTIQLVNLLTPAIYEGINSIYGEVKQIAKDGEELKIFQGFLAKIPTWNEQMISNESTRIKTVTQNSDILDDLIKAVIQSNILLLTSTDIADKHKVLKEFNINLNYNKFIHNVYIEVAKTFYNYPFLFYHKVPALEFKKNQLKSHKLIKEAIEESIRKMLPLQLILKKYLGIMSEINDDKYLKSLVNTENNNQQYQLVTNSQTNKQNNSNDTNKYNNNHNNDHSDSETEFDKKNQIGGIIQSNPPISLREIYEQQKQAGSGVMSPSVKHILLTESKNNNHETEKRHTEIKHSERRHEGGKKVEKINIVIPPQQAENKFAQNFKGMSESSQPYYKQAGGIEEEFSNMHKNENENKYKPSLNPLYEGTSDRNTTDRNGGRDEDKNKSMYSRRY